MKYKNYGFAGDSVVLTENNHFKRLDELTDKSNIRIWNGLAFDDIVAVVFVGPCKLQKITTNNGLEISLGNKSIIEYNNNNSTLFGTIEKSFNTSGVRYPNFNYTAFSYEHLSTVVSEVRDTYIVVGQNKQAIITINGFRILVPIRTSTYLLEDAIPELDKLKNDYFSLITKADKNKVLISINEIIENVIDIGVVI